MSTTLAVSDTSGRILDVAERLVQTRGFNAFSYADIAAALNITKASLHYHFPTKAILGERLVERYRNHSWRRLAKSMKSMSAPRPACGPMSIFTATSWTMIACVSAVCWPRIMRRCPTRSRAGAPLRCE